MAKSLLITGASSGQGVATAIAAANAGYKVHATMRNLAKHAVLDDAARFAGVDLTVHALDVQDYASVQACVDNIIISDRKVDVSIANAGNGFARSTEQASEADMVEVMDINFMGVVRCVKAILPHMRAARTGHVVAITSVGGLAGQPINEIYCGSKFAVEGYIESLASYVGPAFGLDFSAVEPAGIESELVNTVLKKFGATGGMLEDKYLPSCRHIWAAAKPGPLGSCKPLRRWRRL